MVLRSQLRMNKNIVFPFISCIMIMLTLLVLIHKSADELSAAKKEIGLCKQQYDSLYTQLQNAIEYKLRLEKTLQNEKADNKQKIEDVQVLLSQEKEERRKEKEEAENRYEALNQKYRFKESENKDVNENVQSLQKLVLQKEEQISTLNKQLSSLRSEKEQLVAQKDEKINDLETRLRKYDNKDGPVGPPPKRNTPATIDNALGIQQPDRAQPMNANATTPGINPDALAAQDDQNQKVVPPPPPPPQQEDHENSLLQQQMRQDLGAPLSDEHKPEESVINAPDKKDDDLKLSANAENNKNAPNMVLPLPNMEQNKKPQPSIASNNAGEAPQIDERNKVLPIPNQNGIEKVLPKQMNNYNDDYKDKFGEEDGEEGEYMENDIGKGQAIPRKDYKHFDEPNDGGESVQLHPK